MDKRLNNSKSFAHIAQQTHKTPLNTHKIWPILCWQQQQQQQQPEAQTSHRVLLK